MKARVANFLRCIRDRRRYVFLAAENDALKVLLAALSAELEYAGQGAHSVSKRAADYNERRSLVLVPRIIELLDDRNQLLIVEAGAREADRELRQRPFPPARLSLWI
jgi:hypothetical protein